MPTDRVLVEVFTVANMAGIEQANKGLLGLGAATLVAAAAATALVVVGKAAIENAKKQEEAFDQLTQAYSTQKDTLEAHKQVVLAFIEANKAFISDQYDTETAMASVVRAGYDTSEMLRIMGAALDLAAIKHVAVSEATISLIKVLAGNSKALRELGITAEQYNAIMKSTLTDTQKQAALLDLIESKTAKGRDTIDGLAKSQNELNKSWQDFTAKVGPPLLIMLQKLNEAAATGLGILSVYADLVDKLSKIGPFSAGAGQSAAGAQARANALAAGAGPKGHRAAGGPVGPGESYTVGEHGPETLVMGDQGGSIVPNGRGGNEIHIHMHGMVIDGPAMDKFFREGLRRARYAPGT